MYEDARTRAQRQEAEADQFLAGYNSPQMEPAAPAAEPAEAPVAPVETPVSEQPAPAPAPVQPAPAPAVDWEHKYKTLQGIHNSHTADLKNRLRHLEQELQARSQPEPKKPEVPELDTKKDAEVFGEDLVQMVVRIVDTKFGHVVSTFDERLKAIEARHAATTETVAKTAQELFMDRVKGQVTDFETVNNDPEFHAWLGEPDALTGYVRQDILDHAANTMDVTRVVSVFNAFKAAKAPAPAPVAPPAQQQLERQVAPRTTATTQVADTPQVYTVADVERFYADVRRGVYRGKEALANQIETELNLALQQGRIR